MFSRRSDRDAGTALLLVLLFIGALGPLLLALVTFTGSNITNTSNLNSQRGLEFAGDSAVDGAIQAVRYLDPCQSACTAPPTTSACPAYPSATTGLTVNGSTLIVVCSMGLVSTLYGRDVEFDACNVAAATTSFTTCQSKAVVRAQVLFNDVAAGCTSGATSSCYGSSWGTSLTIENWTVLTANG